MKQVTLLITFTFCMLINALSANDEALKRIHAHLTIQDAESARLEAFHALQQSPNHPALSEIYIKALSKACNEKELIRFTKEYLTKFPEKKENRELLETLCWGVIEHANSSTTPLIRIYSLLASFFSNDAKGVHIIQKALKDNNWLIRGAAIQLSGQLKDSKLQNEIFNLITKEPVFAVRLEAIKTAGLMKNTLVKNQLEQIIFNDKAELEEKASAIESLTLVMDAAKRSQVQALSKSSRFGFRLLACSLVLSQELYDDMDLIIPLLQDSRREVRKGALEVIGTLQIRSFQDRLMADIVKPLLNDMEPSVAITAAYVLTMNNLETGQQSFRRFIESDDKEIRLLAASALAKTGKYGFPYIKEAFMESDDRFVKLNLAISLIGQREMVQAACDALYVGLTPQKEQILWVEEGIFKYLAPGNICLKEMIPNQKEAMNQVARLEILNILSIMKYPEAEGAIRQFLNERSWGISAMAAVLLLSEGDDASIKLVQHLLNDPSEKIRIQAALILSLWDSNEEANLVLQTSYPAADREMKERILEGVGRIGSLSSIPFLLDCMDEPFQSLRVIAASSLLQTLYH
jgi:HEAT repeat protein